MNRPVKVSKQTMTVEESSPTILVLAKSSLKAEQQVGHHSDVMSVRSSNLILILINLPLSLLTDHL
jgi:hypothetical protein